MSFTINTTQKQPINLAPQTLYEEVIQNVWFLLSSLEYDIPLNREFGLNAAYIDKPITTATALATADIYDKIGEYEPRAEIVSIDFTTDYEKIIVVEKNEGEKIAYDVSTAKIIFGDDDLMVNIKNRERDEEVTLDICKDTQDGLTVGVNTEAREYVAQVIIPAREYEIVDTGEEDEDGKAITKREPVPFDMKKCTLVLWALKAKKPLTGCLKQ